MQRKQRRLVCEDAPNKLSQSWNCFSKREKRNQCMFLAAIPSHIITSNIHLCTWFRLSPPERHLLYFKSTKLLSPPTHQLYKCWAEWIHGTHAPESTPTSPGRRCSFNARISHGVKYPHQLLQLQTPPHKIHNLQLLQAKGGRGEGEKGKLYQIGGERAAVKAGTSSRRILRWWRGKGRVLYN